MPKKLNSYTGKLIPSQIVDGINAANRNAIRLVTDARILLDSERHPSSTALSILAIEEPGKSYILRHLSTCFAE